MKKICLYIIPSIVFICWTVGIIFFHIKIYNPSKYDIETKTDAIIVVTGGKNRIPIATELLNNNLSENMFISGVGKDISVDAILKRHDVSFERAEKNIEIGSFATDTASNAIEINDWVKNNNISSIRLVTSNYHMPRAVEEILAMNKDISIIEHPVYSNNVLPKWWKNKSSFIFIINEYNKFIYVYFKNKITYLLNIRK